MNKITEKWKKTGLLDETEEIDKLALLLEDLTNILIREHEDKWSKLNLMDKIHYNGFVACSILPTLVRLYRERNDVCPTDMKWFYEDFIKFCNNKYKDFEKLKSLHDIDVEAEFCCFYVDFFKGKV